MSLRAASCAVAQTMPAMPVLAQDAQSTAQVAAVFVAQGCKMTEAQVRTKPAAMMPIFTETGLAATDPADPKLLHFKGKGCN